MDIIKELFYGNIVPCDGPVVRSDAYRRLMNQLVTKEEWLMVRLDEDGRKLLEEYADIYDDLLDLSVADYFSIGFRMGQRFGAQGRYLRRDRRTWRKLRRSAALPARKRNK